MSTPRIGSTIHGRSGVPNNNNNNNNNNGNTNDGAIEMEEQLAVMGRLPTFDLTANRMDTLSLDRQPSYMIPLNRESSTLPLGRESSTMPLGREASLIPLDRPGRASPMGVDRMESRLGLATLFRQPSREPSLLALTRELVAVDEGAERAGADRARRIPMRVRGGEAKQMDDQKLPSVGKHWSGEDAAALARHARALHITESRLDRTPPKRTKTFARGMRQAVHKWLGGGALDRQTSASPGSLREAEQKVALTSIYRVMTVTPSQVAGNRDQSRFHNISYPLIIRIMSYLDAKSLCAFTCTSTRMYEISHSPHAHILWDRLLFQDFPRRFQVLKGHLSHSYDWFTDHLQTQEEDPKDADDGDSDHHSRDGPATRSTRSSTVSRIDTFALTAVTPGDAAEPQMPAEMVRRRDFVQSSNFFRSTYGGALLGGVSKQHYLDYRNRLAEFYQDDSLGVRCRRCTFHCRKILDFGMAIAWIMLAVGIGLIANLLKDREVVSFSAHFLTICIAMGLFLLCAVVPLWAKYIGWPFPDTSYEDGHFGILSFVYRWALDDSNSAIAATWLMVGCICVSIVGAIMRGSEMWDVDWWYVFLPMHLALVMVPLLFSGYFNVGAFGRSRMIFVFFFMTMPLHAFFGALPHKLNLDQTDDSSPNLAIIMIPLWIWVGTMIFSPLILGAAGQQGMVFLFATVIAHLGQFIAITVLAAVYVDCSINQGRGNDATRSTPRSRVYKTIDEETQQEIWIGIDLSHIFIPMYVSCGLNALVTLVLHRMNDMGMAITERVDGRFDPTFDGVTTNWRDLFGPGTRGDRADPNPWALAEGEDEDRSQQTRKQREVPLPAPDLRRDAQGQYHQEAREAAREQAQAQAQPQEGAGERTEGVTRTHTVHTPGTIDWGAF